MGDILVIGNGFDLHHGMKTNYIDLINFMKNIQDDINYVDKKIRDIFVPYFNNDFLSHCINDLKYTSNKTWIDLEIEIKIIIVKLLNFLQSESERKFSSIQDYKNYKYSHNINDSTQRVLLKDIKSIFNDNGEEYEINKKFITAWNTIDTDEVMKNMEEQLSDLESILRLYLKYAEKKYRDEDKYKIDEQINSISPDYVINFNYTDTISEIYNIDKEKICYVHGSIDKENIVLGYDDKNSTQEEIVFKKYYRRIIKGTDKIEWKNMHVDDGYGGYHEKNIHFYGHSLDISDEDILCKLMTSRAKKIIYYMDNVDYATKIKNVILLLGKDEALKKIHNKEIEFVQIKTINKQKTNNK